MPNRVHITTSCCQINCGGQGDIAINIQHTKPPKINHSLVANVCERPAVVARCPGGGNPSGHGGRQADAGSRREEMHLLRRLLSALSAHADQRSRALEAAIWVGGNHSNARSKPSFQKLVAAGIPNNPPRWPEVPRAIVKTILGAYKEDARDWERINDWIDRIGWPRFFELTGTALHQVPHR